jgi:hypothetical protein
MLQLKKLTGYFMVIIALTASITFLAFGIHTLTDNDGEKAGIVTFKVTAPLLRRPYRSLTRDSLI